MSLTQYLRAKGLWPERAILDIAPALQETGEQMAAEMGETPEWIKHAAPLIERFEGMARLIPGDKVEAYPDPATGGKPWTIGIGSTRDEAGKPIEPGTIWTVERARKRFETELQEFAKQVDAFIAGKPTTARQKAACVSLAYNIGQHGFSRSTVLKMHRAGNYQAAGDAFLMWNRANNKVMNGLVRRRNAERELYLSG